MQVTVATPGWVPTNVAEAPLAVSVPVSALQAYVIGSPSGSEAAQRSAAV